MSVPKIKPGTTVEEVLRAVVQGNPGAAEALHGVKETFTTEDYLRIVAYLYEYGPRGDRLYERFKDRCNKDSFVLGRDVLAQISEQEGFEVDA